jgi:hypothetical protein
MFETGEAPRPIETGRGQTLPVATRWDLYRRQQGRDWSDFLTKEEYDRYLGEFTFIKERMSQMYQLALQVRSEFDQVKELAPLYFQLNVAASNASLSLDGQGNLVLQVKSESFLKLLSDATAKAILAKAGSRLSTLILGKDVLGPLGLLFDMYQLYNRIQNERLVGAVGQEANKARFQKQLSLIMDIVAADKARRTGENPALVKIRLHEQYHKFQKALNQHMLFVEINRSLDPNKPTWTPRRPPQIMYPAPAGAIR